MPARVHPLDEPRFFLRPPIFKLRFVCIGLAWVGPCVVIDETHYMIPHCETFARLLSMLRVGAASQFVKPLPIVCRLFEAMMSAKKASRMADGSKAKA